LLRLALVTPQPRHAHRSAQFPGLCLLLSRNPERNVKIRLSLCRVPLRRLSTRLKMLARLAKRAV
jgi:hypothetical protein